MVLNLETTFTVEDPCVESHNMYMFGTEGNIIFKYLVEYIITYYIASRTY